MTYAEQPSQENTLLRRSGGVCDAKLVDVRVDCAVRLSNNRDVAGQKSASAGLQHGRTIGLLIGDILEGEKVE